MENNKKNTSNQDRNIADQEPELFNWMAQCKRRILYPIDQNESIGLSAFEYCWKTFNALYKSFPGLNEREKMYACLDSYLDFHLFIGNVMKDILRLYEYSKDIPKTRSKSHFQKGIVVSVYGYDFGLQVRKNTSTLKVALKTGDEKEISYAIIDLLYTFRNARVHGERRMSSPLADSTRYLVGCLPSITLELCANLICKKMSIEREKFEKIIDAQVKQFIDEINMRVKAYERKKHLSSKDVEEWLTFFKSNEDADNY